MFVSWLVGIVLDQRTETFNALLDGLLNEKQWGHFVTFGRSIGRLYGAGAY